MIGINTTRPVVRNHDRIITRHNRARRRGRRTHFLVRAFQGDRYNARSMFALELMFFAGLVIMFLAVVIGHYWASFSPGAWASFVHYGAIWFTIGGAVLSFGSYVYATPSQS